ncbi:TAF6-like RNA polymerase II p300/CBP-associated factor-associated factor 65 kDa subunit 6L isoform X2 [Acanthaster planci]|uniref:TAF6-like RNA polymerase II p300/CBP-associated factor-associated factor 65 kDa subunit 6L isoform X2 n=1 Tax=Acanthaster planci TaxID=133434 RepID=A0A8B7YTB0_ACAPL|nr:TAF6-like RNA polymerase II p300/CBP-associated factor-associated factor 65 kDa subunit 6L isoform X2 [Acanthaster planci]
MAEDKKFAMLSSGSVKVVAESAGVSSLSDEIAGMIAEDVCYRLREVTQASTQFMKHAKRKRLHSEDFNKALRWSDVEPIHGHGSNDPLTFIPIKDSELFFVEDKEINLIDLATDTKIPSAAGTTSIKASWVAIEGIQKPSGSQAGTVTHKFETLSQDLQQYYKDATKAILESDHQQAEIFLSDLRRNTKVSGLLPYFANFVSCGVKMVSHDLGQLMRLMQLVDALIHNQVLFLGPYLMNLISTVMYCILEPLAVSINPLNDHWALRDYAARLLSQILRSSIEIMGRFEHQLLATLKEVLSDPARPLCSHYGAVVGLCALGTRAVEEVLVSQLSTYWPILQQVLEDTSISNSQVKMDGHKVHGAILAAAEMLLKSKEDQPDGGESPSPSYGQSPNASPDHQAEFAFGTASHLMHLSSTGISGSTAPEPIKKPKHCSISDTYSHLYEYLGDSLTMRLHPRRDPGKRIPEPPKDVDLMQLLNAESQSSHHYREDYHRGLMSLTRQKFPNRPRLPSGGTAREGLRPRHAKTPKKIRGRAASLKDAFPLAKTIKIHKSDFKTQLSIPGKLVSLRTKRGTSEGSSTVPSWLKSNSDVWKINMRMAVFGKRRIHLMQLPENLHSNLHQRAVCDLNAMF